MSKKDAFNIRALRLVRFFAYIVVVIGITTASVGYKIAQQQGAHAANMRQWDKADATVRVYDDPSNPANAVFSTAVFPGIDHFQTIRLNPTGVLIAGIGLAIAGLVLVRYVSSVVELVMRKYDGFIGDPSRITPAALDEFYPGLESARFFGMR